MSNQKRGGDYDEFEGKRSRGYTDGRFEMRVLVPSRVSRLRVGTVSCPDGVSRWQAPSLGRADRISRRSAPSSRRRYL